MFLSIFLVFSFICPSVYGWNEDLLATTTSGVEKISFVNKVDDTTALTTKLDTYIKDKISGNVKWDGSVLGVTSKGVDYPLFAFVSTGVNNPGYCYVKASNFDEVNNKDSIKAVKILTDALINSGASPDVVQQIVNDINDVDTSIGATMLPMIFEGLDADMFSAYKITAPFLDILSIVLGVGAVLLILVLLFSTVMDLAYIGLPVWREAQSEKNGGNKHPFGVSYEALRTVNEIEANLGGNGGNGEYRNAYLLYFKRRALTYIILAICIMYLICGGLSGIIAFVLSLVSGITG